MLEQRIETSMKIEAKAKKNKAVMKEFNKTNFRKVLEETRNDIKTISIKGTLKETQKNKGRFLKYLQTQKNVPTLNWYTQGCQNPDSN